MSLRKVLVILSKNGLMAGVYHIDVGENLTTVTVGSIDMTGMNHDLCRHGSPSARTKMAT